MTIKEALGLHEDAAVLLAHILKKNTAYLFANPEKQLSPLPATSYQLLIRKRANHWPVAYLTGHKEFFGLDFKVTPDVLIPRPETETLVELALQMTRNSKFRNLIDLGTGSGNIIISIAKTLRRYAGLDQHTNQLLAIDSSAKALKVAKANARRHGVANKIKFLKGNLLDPLLHLPLVRGRKSGGHSVIIANLPYLKPRQLHEPSIQHEPKNALSGGPDGLKYYKKLFKQIKKFCHPALDAESITLLLIEFDPSQKQKIKGLVESYFPNGKIKFHKDLAGNYRCAIITYGR